ncbi:MAG: ATP-binding cassette domain-containing protein [Actinomycetota bacterium]
MIAITVSGLRKSFRRRLRGRTLAVDDLDLEVPTGGVYGFLGPNGSGKTTTIRCLLGLVRPDEGACTVLGRDVPRALPNIVRQVGSMVETPTFFGGFSGRRNLELLARSTGVPVGRIDPVLERVGLGARGDDRFRTYSLGMKQRLGLAAVLLKDPELLVLDEPANGLDPAGLKEVRELLRSLADEGRTVFLSSHLLHEVQAICDSVAIVARGRLIAQGPVEEVLAVRGGNAFVVRSPKIRVAKKVLHDAGFSASFRGDKSLRVAAPLGQASKITRSLAEAGIYLTELRPEEISLEAVFLELTGGDPI